MRLLDRLALLPRLEELVDQQRRQSGRRWFSGQGFKPEPNDQRKGSSKARPWGAKTLFLDAKSRQIDLFLLESDCAPIGKRFQWLHRLPEAEAIFRGPHVLVTHGMRVAFCPFDVVFRHAVQSISGDTSDASLLIFLAAYLRSKVARYYLFHTTSNVGVGRPKVHASELLRLPFPLPDQQPDAKRCWQIVEEVAEIVTEAARKSSADLALRQEIVRAADAATAPLIEEYFEIQAMENPLIEDTLEVTIPSIQPTLSRMPVPTVAPSSASQRDAYRDRVCAMLNDWGKCGKFEVRGQVYASGEMGIGVAVLEKVSRASAQAPASEDGHDLLLALDHLRKAFPQLSATLDVVRGTLVFDKNRLYVVKPISQRHWTQTAAMNDADEIAGTILMRPRGEDA